MRRRIAGREVARGDILIVSEGDRIAADALLFQGGELAVDEFSLTGESVPVRKVVADRGRDVANRAKRVTADTPFLFSGTLEGRGQGIAEVTATGSRSEIGKIGASLANIETEPPRLKAETIPSSTGGDCARHGVLAGGVLSGLTVFTVMGAWRISQAHVLIRAGAGSDVTRLPDARSLLKSPQSLSWRRSPSAADLPWINGETVSAAIL